MKTKLKTTLALLAAFCGLQLFTATPAWAAGTPIVVWDHDFGTTQKTGTDNNTYTFDLNGNTLNSDGTIKITGSQGAKININNSRNDATVIIKYRNLSKVAGGKAYLLSAYAHQTSQDFDDGISTTNANTLSIMGAFSTGTTLYGNAYTLSEGTGYAQIAYKTASSSGSDLYTATIPPATLIGSGTGGTQSGLKFGNTPITGVTLGGIRGTAKSGWVTTWPNVEIEAVAVFDGYKAVTHNDVKNYMFPSDPLYGYHYNGSGSAYTPSSFTSSSSGNFVDGFLDQAMWINDNAGYGTGLSIGNNDFTVVFVAKSANTQNKIFFGLGSKQAAGFGFVSNGSSGLKFGNWSSNSLVFDQALNVASGQDATADYHTYVVKYVKSETKAYYSVDGSDYTEISTAMTWGGDGSWQIGSIYGGTVGSYAAGNAGAMDELRIYKKCLSIDDVKAIVKEFSTSETYTATIPTGNVAFKDITWNDGKTWSSGDRVQAEITLQGDTTLTIDANSTGRKLVVKSAAGQKLTLNTTGKGFRFLDLSAAAGKVAIAVDGAEIAKNAVAGAPYSYWIGSTVTGEANLETPTVPSGYSISLNTVVGVGSRFVVTAPATAKFGSIGLNFMGAKDQSTSIENARVGSLTTNVGVHPAIGTSWNDLEGKNQTDTSVTKYVNTAGTTVTTGNMSVTVAGVNNTYGTTAAAHSLFYGYLDDGGSPNVTVSNIPFSKYRVVVYSTTDNDGKAMSAAQIGLTSSSTRYYYGPNRRGAAGATLSGSSNKTWGNASSRTDCSEGLNCVISDVLEGNSAYVKMVKTDNDNRGCLCAIQIVEVGIPVHYEATVTEDGKKWSELDWTPAIPSSGMPSWSDCVLTNGRDADVTTVNMDSTVSVGKFTVVSATKVLKFGSPSKLTVTAYDFSQAPGGVGFSATGGWDVPELLRNYIRDNETKVVFYSDNDNSGATLTYAASGTSVFQSHVVFEGGTHNFQYGQNAERDFAAHATAANPTLLVKNNTVLNLKGHDMCGWSGTANLNGIIEVQDGGRINLQHAAGGGTFFYRQRLTINPGGVVNVDNMGLDFCLVGGTAENTAQIYVPPSDGSKVALITGTSASDAIYLHRENTLGAAIYVDAGSTLDIQAKVANVHETKNHEIKKYGTGTLKLSGDLSEFWNDGKACTVVITTAAGNTELATAGAVKCGLSVADEANLKLTGNGTTISGVISGAGNVVRNGAGTVTLSGANDFSGGTTVEAGTLKVNEGASIGTGDYTVNASGTLDLPSTFRPTTSPALVGSSTGVVGITLTALELTTFEGGEAMTLEIPVGGDTLAATIKVYDLGGTEHTIETPTISGGKLSIQKKADAKVPPFNATNPTTANWTAASWVDSTPGDPKTVGYDDWGTKVGANITLASGTTTLTADRDITLATLGIGNAGTLSILPGSQPMTADTIDDSASTGTTTIGFAIDSATVVAGHNTVVETAFANNVITNAADKKLTVKSGAITYSKTVNAGTLNFNGGSDVAPIVYTADGGKDADLGTMTLAAGAYVKVMANENKIYHVTGQGANSYFELTRDSGFGTTTNTQFRNLTLVSAATSGKKLWIQVADSFDSSVNVRVKSGEFYLYGYSPTIGTLDGTGAVTHGSSEALTITPTADATYSGASTVPFTIASGSYTQTLSGAYTGALTVQSGGKVALSGSADPSAITSTGLVTVPAGQLTHNITLNSGAVLNVTTNTPGLASYSITSGTFTPGEGSTVQLNGTNLPTSDYVVRGNAIVRQKSATIDTDKTWAQLWEGGTPPESTEAVQLTVTANATLTFENSTTVAEIKVVSAEGNKLTFADATNLHVTTLDLSTAAGGLEIDCTGLAGEQTILTATIVNPEKITGANVPSGYTMVADATGIRIYRNDTGTRVNPVTGGDPQTFNFAFVGEDGAWGTLTNWRTLEDGLLKPYTYSTLPMVHGSDRWEPTLVDGALFANKTVTCDEIEGWNARLAVMGGAQLTIGNVRKFAGSSFWIWVDATSKLTISAFGSDTYTRGFDAYVANNDGLTFSSELTRNQTYNYYLKGLGSVKYAAGVTAGTHAIKQFQLVMGTGENKCIKRQQLVSFAEKSNTPTFSWSDAAVSVDDETTGFVKLDVAPTLSNNFGDYFVQQAADGVYVTFVGRSIYATLTWDNTNQVWKDAAGQIATPTANSILTVAAGDDVNFGTAVAAHSVSMPLSGTVTMRGYHNLGVPGVAIPGATTLKVVFPDVEAASIPAITNVFAGAGTLELALATTAKFTTSMPIAAANFGDGFTGGVKFSAGQFKATNALKDSIPITVVDGAQLFIPSDCSGTWGNAFTVSGNGYGGSSGYDRLALRFEKAFGSAATITTASDDTYPTPVIGTYSGNVQVGNTISGVGVRIYNYNADDNHMLIFTAPKTQFGGLNGPVEILNGIVKYGNSASSGAGDYVFGTSLKIDSGAELRLWLAQNDTRGFTTPITMNGGTLKSQDGKYTFSSVTIAAASTISMAYGKTFTFTELNGSANLTLTQYNGETGTFAFSGGNYSGTITASGSANFSPTGAALKDATVILNASSMKLVTDTTTVIKLIKMGNNSCLKDNAATINAGTTLDYNGKSGVANNFTLNGGILINTATGLSASSRQMGSLVVNADSAVGGTQTFGMVNDGYNAIELTLGNNTLVKTNANTFLMTMATVTGAGTIEIDEGTLEVTANAPSGSTPLCTFNDGTVQLDAGTLMVDANATLSLHGLTVNGGTVSNSGAITNLAVLAGTVDFNNIGGTVGFADAVTIADGTTTLSEAASTALADKTVTVTGTLDCGTYRPTLTLDSASTGTVIVKLTDDTDFNAGTAIPLFTVSDGTSFAGTVRVFDSKGSERTIKALAFAEGKVVIQRSEDDKMPPFNLTNPTGSVAWTAEGWMDSSETPRSVASTDWNNTVGANIALESGEATRTLDRSISLSTLNITNAGTLAIADTGDFTLTAVTIDDSASTGTTALNFALGTANVTAGANTIIGKTGEGTLTVGEGKKATLIDATFTSYSASSGAFFRWNNAETTAYTQASAAPIGNVNVTNAFNNATVTYDTGKYLLRVENGDNVTLKKSGDYIDARIVMTGGNLALGGGEAMFLGKDAGTLLDMTGGTATFSKACDDKTSYANNFSIGWSGGTAYAVTVAGGTLAVPNAYILPWEGASIAVGNGGVIRAKGIYRRDGGKTAASVSVNAGGTVEVGEYGLVSDSSNKLGVTLNGGMLANSATNTVAFPNGLAISADSVISNDYAMTISAPLSGAGSLTKKGTGTLTLTGANTRTGTTTIEAGTVKFASTDVMGSTAITVNDAATIKVGITDAQYASGLMLSNVTLGTGRNIIFVLPNGTEVQGSGNKINSADYWYEFNGNRSAKTGTTDIFNGGNPDYDISPNVKAALIKNAGAPYFANRGSEDSWTVMTFAKTVNIANSPIWALGKKSTGGVALVSDGADGVTFGRFIANTGMSTAAGEIITVPSISATLQYHLYVVVCEAVSGGKQFTFYVDGVSKGSVTIDMTITSEGQIGNVYDNLTSTMPEADGAFIDEWRFYKQAVPAVHLAALAEAFPVSPTTLHDTISVNVMSTASGATAIANTRPAGVYQVLGANWNAIAGQTDAGMPSVTLNNAQELKATGEKAATSAKVTIAGRNIWNGFGGTTTGNGQMAKHYIDDGTVGSIDVEDIPYSQYTLYIYMGTDQNVENKQFRPVEVYQNGVRVVSESLPTANWGDLKSCQEVNGTLTLTEKGNYLKVEGLTAQTLRIQGNTGSGGNRCGLAAIQIVNTGYRYTPYTAKITGENVAWDGGAGTGLSEHGTWSGTQAAPQPIVLTNTVAGATLTFNTDTYASSVTIVSAADKPLTILKGDTNAFNPGMFNIEGALGGVTFGYAPLNAGLAMGANVTATVSENAFGGAFNVGTTASGPASSTLVFNLGQNVIQEVVGSATDANHKYRLKVVSGVLNFTQGGGATAFAGREVVADGGAAIIRLNHNDATGYGTTATGIKAYNGAQIQMQVRDTFLTPIELQAGTFTLMKGCGESSRAFDLFGTHTWTISALDGATAENPTVSYLAAESDASDVDRTVYCRGGTWTIDVAENAQFFLDNVFLRTMGISGASSNLFAIVKSGLGELVLNNKVDPAGFGAPWTINAGKVTLLDASALGTGLVTIAEGATLEFDMGLFGNLETTTKIMNIANDGSASRVNVLNAANYPWLKFGTEGEDLGKIVVDWSKFPVRGLHFVNFCPKPGTTAQTRDPNGRTSGWIDLMNYNEAGGASVNLKDYKIYRYNISKKAKPETMSNLCDYELAPGKTIRVYISEDYPNAEDHGGDGDNLKVEWYGTNAQGKVVKDGLDKIMIIPQKVNPKKYPMVMLYENTTSVTNGILDQTLVPCDIDDGAIVELGANTNRIERTVVQKGVRTDYGPDVSPVYGIKDTKTDLELLNKHDGFVPADADYWLTLPINPFTEGGTPHDSEIESVQIEYRDFGLNPGESQYASTTNRVVKKGDKDEKDYGKGCLLWEGFIPQTFLAGKAGHLIQFRARILDKGGKTWLAPRGLNKDVGHMWYGFVVQPETTTVVDAANKNKVCLDRLQTFLLFVDNVSIDQMDKDILDQNKSKVPYGARVNVYDTQTHTYYDNVRIDLRGQTSAGFVKKSHGLRFSKVAPLACKDPFTEDKIESRKTSFVADYGDPTALRQSLSCRLLGDAGVKVPFSYPVRLYLNGEYYQLASHSNRFTDELVEDYYGLSPKGYGYKNVGMFMPNTPPASGGRGCEKKTPDDDNELDMTVLNEYTARLAAAKFNEGGSISEADKIALTKTVMTNFNIAAWVNYLAAVRVTQENDDVWTNLGGYINKYDEWDNPNGDDTLMPLAYDLNLSWGQWFYNDDAVTPKPGIYATNDWFKCHPFYGGWQIRCHKKNGGTKENANYAYETLYQNEQIREMFLRRFRTLMDTYLGAPGTPKESSLAWQWVVGYTNVITGDIAYDHDKWEYSQMGTNAAHANDIWDWTNGAFANDYGAAIDDLWDNYFVPRRQHLYVTHSVTNVSDTWQIGYGKDKNAGIPLAQSDTTNFNGCVYFTDEFNKRWNEAGYNYCTNGIVQLCNTKNESLDLSGWSIGGAVDAIFPNGTVIPAAKTVDANTTTGSIWIVYDRQSASKFLAERENGTDKPIIINLNKETEKIGGGTSFVLRDPEGVAIAESKFYVVVDPTTGTATAQQSETKVENSVDVPMDWIDAYASESVNVNTNAQGLADQLVSTNHIANGIAPWQSYVLGLVPDIKESKPVILPVQTKDASKVTFKLGGIEPADQTAVDIMYKVWKGATPGAKTTPSETVGKDEQITITLPDSGVEYYLIEVTTPAKTK